MTLVIADARQPAFGLLYIASARGYFEEAGLEVRTREFELGKDALADVLAGHSDVATVYTTPVVNQTLAGHEIGIIGTLHRSTRNTGLVARRDRGIATLEDLSGKAVGLTKGISSEYFLELLLTSAGMDPRSVRLMDRKPSELVPALQLGELDAVVVWGPHFAAAKQLEGREWVVFPSDLYPETSVLAVAGGASAGKPEALKRLLKALVAAEDFYVSNRQEAAGVIAAHLGASEKERNIRSVESSTLLTRMDNVLLNSMQEEARWMAGKRGGDAPVPNMARLMRPEFLEWSRAQAVTLFDR